MRKLIAILLIAVMTVLCLPTVASAEADVVTIYHTNDIHSYVKGKDEDSSSANGALSLAQVATVHKANENSLLVDSGDFNLGGSNYGNLTNGQSVAEAMSAAGYDLGILGNHEFDKGVANFEEVVKVLTYPIISSNISIKEGYEEVSPYLASMEKTKILEVNGHKIGFFSIDTPTLVGMVSPSTLEKGGVLCDTDIIAVSEACVKELQEKGAEVIIAVNHCGYAEVDTEGDNTKLNSYHVAQVAGVDAVIDGHDHVYRLADSAENVDGTLVVSTGTALAHLGALEITFTDDGVSIVSKDATDEAASMGEDAETKAVVDKWTEQVSSITNQVAFKSEANFYGGNISGWNSNDEKQTTAVARRGYTNAGQLIADVRQVMAENWVKTEGPDYGVSEDTPVVGTFGGGSVRGSFNKGDVTLGDLMTAYSFSFGTDAGDGDKYILISPKTLWQKIEHGVNFFISQDPETGYLTANGSVHGRFPQVTGFSYTFDITQTPSTEAVVTDGKVTKPTELGARVLSITLDDGTELDKNDDTTRLLLITGDYEIGGGDGYWMHGYAEDWDGFYTDIIFTQPMACGWYLIDYVNDVLGGTIPADLYPLVSDRIKMVNMVYTAESWNSKVTLADPDGNPITGKDVKVIVDGVETTLKTDDEGKFFIEGLANGAHEVEIVIGDLDKTYYLDNFCGLCNILATATPSNPDTGFALGKTVKF